jgi:hypothetical protein
VAGAIEYCVLSDSDSGSTPKDSERHCTAKSARRRFLDRGFRRVKVMYRKESYASRQPTSNFNALLVVLLDSAVVGRGPEELDAEMSHEP